jgi:hypothetical protein
MLPLFLAVISLVRVGLALLERASALLAVISGMGR